MSFFGVEKFFRVFQPFLPLEMMFLKKNFSKNLPKKGQNPVFFLGHPVIYVSNLPKVNFFKNFVGGQGNFFKKKFIPNRRTIYVKKSQ